MQPSDRERRAEWPVHKGRLGEAEPNPYAHLSPEERIGLVWEITRAAWAFRGHGVVDSTLQRYLVRFGRRKDLADVEALEQGDT
jgi:hypothetical protein